MEKAQTDERTVKKELIIKYLDEEKYNEAREQCGYYQRLGTKDYEIEVVQIFCDCYNQEDKTKAFYMVNIDPSYYGIYSDKIIQEGTRVFGTKKNWQDRYAQEKGI